MKTHIYVQIQQFAMTQTNIRGIPKILKYSILDTDEFAQSQLGTK